ncbi:hypothetical protein MMIC_P0185 [Mariprofundus micogutta]|uniref:Uncharacterized protein n=1 Tax=Mariprofundus micogutta TaxID=1921010 RepID=A0A1L8CK15_9PROT|nr:hypothetical protein [Mariprofundus micogutta]GAV19252.1 hypothetical protein MMIC_P0185 [Mariprofundus micogutta]
MQQQSVQLTALSDFGINMINNMGNPWYVQKITAHVLFSNHPGPWMLLERDHFHRWVNLSADQNFSVRWKGWKH